MTVYLGDSGCIQLQRAAGSAVNITLLDGDVSVEKKRFSPEEDIQGTFITGDLVDISTKDGSLLRLVAGHNFDDWRGYVFIDSLGSLRLYEKYEDAIAGELGNALPLVAYAGRQDLLMETRGDNYTPLGQVTGYEFTTERETIQTTHLGNQFVQQYEAGLISGQGTIECLWSHKANLCDPDNCGSVEFPAYLAQLCIRLNQGADFFGQFFVYKGDPNENSVWYESECVVTSASISVSATQLVRTTIQFVTTGQFKLLTGIPPAYLLMEDGFSYVLKEDGVSRLLIAE